MAAQISPQAPMRLIDLKRQPTEAELARARKNVSANPVIATVVYELVEVEPPSFDRHTKQTFPGKRLADVRAYAGRKAWPGALVAATGGLPPINDPAQSPELRRVFENLAVDGFTHVQAPHSYPRPIWDVIDGSEPWGR